MAILKYNASPRPAASMQNVNYILRDDACVKFETINLPEIQTKIDARSFAANRMLEEDLMPKREQEKGKGNGKGKGKKPREERNHHRMMVTLPDETDPNKALHLVKNFVEKEFPGTRSIIAIHESDNGIGLHSHIWIDARKVDGKKLDLGLKYTRLDKIYSQKYDQVYGTNYTTEFAAKRKFNAENKIPTYEKQLQILIQRQKQNEQDRIRSGKYITETAGRRIDEINTVERNKLEVVARYGQPESGRIYHQRENEKPSIQTTPHPERLVQTR
jgi:hypothetical protein